ncbi:hypothetical protein EDI_335060 [Entamoeba dispar SAW760]|uniref:Uncharacterized protein n=1 Tax=Entamoeba dispar (strain ATCC PRA-260 / SAW760) TaxID=370354 RepID=B0ESY7_ENTDS|nr:uncharacterized protein EDI_335060 [Entamoeba dispar SAW760]EDR22350.1 hypothetical protein EDI_335060 [Entamoeba dispar SAW760]|eukprot:EDR22350.1 hypothetical protein EDI_335060 [Entamoeba dispar SAW760]
MTFKPQIKIKFNRLVTECFDISGCIQKKYEIPNSYISLINKLTEQRNATLRQQPTKQLLNVLIIYLSSLISIYKSAKWIGVDAIWKTKTKEFKSSLMKHELMCILYNIGVTYCEEGDYKSSLPYLTTALDISKSINGILGPEEIDCISRIIASYSEENPRKALSLLGKSAKILKRINSNEKIWAKLVEVIEIGRYSIVIDEGWRKYAVDSLHKLIEKTDLNEFIKITLRMFCGEIGKGKGENKDWVWNETEDIQCERIDIENNESEWKIKKIKEEVKEEKNIQEEVQLIPNRINCGWTITLLLDLIKEEEIFHRINKIEEENKCYGQGNLEKELIDKLEAIKKLTYKIQNLKQTIQSQRTGIKEISDTDKFNEWLKCGDQSVCENLKNDELIDQKQWDQIGVTIQTYVAYQSVLEMIKDIEKVKQETDKQRKDDQYTQQQLNL